MNSTAMAKLSSDDHETCLTMLQKCERLTDTLDTGRAVPGTESLRVLTFNNLACLHHRQGKLKVAFRYLRAALELADVAETKVKNLAHTHLNMCEIFTQLGRNGQALEHAQAAVFHAQQEYVAGDDEGDNSSTDSSSRGSKSMSSSDDL